MRRHGKHLDIPLTLLRRIVYLFRRYFRGFLLFLTACLLLDIILTVHASRPAPQASTSTDTKHEKIYIASLHWNGQKLIHDYWAPAVLDLVRHFGKDNVYVSILAGGSLDGAEGALWELDLELERLGVERNVEIREQTHADEVNRVPEEGEEGWVMTRRGKKELRRIPYLAGLRNRAMEKLKDLAERSENKRRFDKILWLNDVIFNTQDVLTLLSTNHGHYSAACSIDFAAPPLYYDTFALRDSSGAQTTSMTWPYFLSPLSRSSMQALSPVPVQSCWNGIVAFDASPFYPISNAPALKFRGLPDSLAKHHLEASECCLIHADNPLSHQNGVYLNPNVRVAYNPAAHEVVHPMNGKWPSNWQKVSGMWANRWGRWTGWMSRYVARRRVEGRIAKWRDEEVEDGEEYHREVGAACVINEMQVLIWNGWLHL